MTPDVLTQQLKKLLPTLISRKLDLGDFDVEIKKLEHIGETIIITIPIEKFLEWNLENNGKDFNDYSIRSKMLVSNKFKMQIESIVEKAVKYFTNVKYRVRVDYLPKKS